MLKLCDWVITDIELRDLSSLTALTRLDMEGCEYITEGGLVAALSALPALEFLKLPQSRITDTGLVPLSSLTALRSLDFSEMCRNHIRREMCSSDITHSIAGSELVWVPFGCGIGGGSDEDEDEKMDYNDEDESSGEEASFGDDDLLSEEDVSRHKKQRTN